MFKRKLSVVYAILLMAVFGANAQVYDVLIKGGHVIDPKNNIDQLMDVAIKGDTIALIAKKINPREAKQIIDATNLYVTPGLIDIHAHTFYGTLPDHYLSNGLEAIQPDGFTLRNGVTTIVDAGGPGWKNFQTFKEQTIDHSKTRVFAFVDIVGEGMRGGPYEQDMKDMDAKLTAMVVQQHKEIVGVKVAHYSGAEWTPVERAVEAGNIAQVPVMIDFGGHIPELSLEQLLCKTLRPGDIFTHCYANVVGRGSIADSTGKVYDYVLAAQKRGIIFDVGHGGGSFAFSQAVPAVKSGFLPNTISTDLHTTSMNGGMKDMLNVMSKFLNMNMSLSQIIAASTWKPAQVIHREQLGNLSVGAPADIAILNVRQGKFGFIDAAGFKMDGDKKFECEMTFRDGKVVYDLNGLSRPMWNVR